MDFTNPLDFAAHLNSISNYYLLVNCDYDYRFGQFDAGCSSACYQLAAFVGNLDIAAGPSGNNCFCFDAGFGCCYGNFYDCNTNCCY